MDEPVARRIHPGTQRMELGLLPATDGAVLERGPQGKTGAEKRPGNGGENIHFLC